MTPLERYYFSRHKTSGQFQVNDRTFSEVIALCRYRENAVMIVGALRRPINQEISGPEYDKPLPAGAIL